MNSPVGMGSSSLPWNLESCICACRSERKSGGFLPVNEILVLEKSALMDLPCPGWGGPAELCFATKATFWFQSRRIVLQVSPACIAEMWSRRTVPQYPKRQEEDRTSSHMTNCSDSTGYCIRTRKSFMLQCLTRVWCLVCHFPIPVMLQWDTREENRWEGRMESCGAP